jgi:dihydrodipicolinate synthase/N-acetylneuraminate lyase
MKNRELLHGMMAHLPTVFRSSGELDELAMRANIGVLRRSGIRAIYYPGASAEFFNLSPQEYRCAIQTFVEEAGADCLKIAGGGWPRLGETLEMAQWLAGSGVDAFLVILPYFVPLAPAERVECLRQIAAAAPALGIIHYNTTYAPAVRCSCDDYVALQDVSNFWGTKQGSIRQEEWDELRGRTPDMRHLPLDDWLLPAMRAGGHGSFSLVTSLSPAFALRFFRECDTRNWEQAGRMDAEWRRFIDLVYVPLSQRGYSDISVDKACIDCFGVLKAGAPRKPLHSVSSADQDWIREQICRERYFYSAE